MSEAFIKSALDGLFFYTDEFGMTRVKAVPKDYIPRHRMAGVGDDVPKVRNVGGRPRKLLSQAEEEDLFQARRSGVSWDALALKYQADVKTLRDRFIAICIKRGVPYELGLKPVVRSPMPADLQATISEMRERGASLMEISQSLDLKYYVVRDFCRRNLREAA